MPKTVTVKIPIKLAKRLADNGFEYTFFSFKEIATLNNLVRKACERENGNEHDR